MLNWNVKVTEKGYIINLYFADEIDLILPLNHLLSIQDVNPVRVSGIALIRPQKNQTHVRVFVSNRDQPVCVTETDIVRVRKRKRFGGFF